MTGICSQMNTMSTASGSGCFSAHNFNRSAADAIMMVSLFVCALLVNAGLNAVAVRVLPVIVAAVVIKVGAIRNI